jgi:hypothetical protein
VSSATDLSFQWKWKNCEWGRGKSRADILLKKIEGKAANLNDKSASYLLFVL